MELYLSVRIIFSISQPNGCVFVAGYMGEPVLLPVWVSLPSFHHSHCISLTDLYRHGLLPAVWGGQFGLGYL